MLTIEEAQKACQKATTDLQSWTGISDALEKKLRQDALKFAANPNRAEECARLRTGAILYADIRRKMDDAWRKSSRADRALRAARKRDK